MPKFLNKHKQKKNIFQKQYLFFFSFKNRRTFFHSEIFTINKKVQIWKLKPIFCLHKKGGSELFLFFSKNPLIVPLFCSLSCLLFFSGIAAFLSLFSFLFYSNQRGGTRRGCGVVELSF